MCSVVNSRLIMEPKENQLVHFHIDSLPKPLGSCTPWQQHSRLSLDNFFRPRPTLGDLGRVELLDVVAPVRKHQARPTRQRLRRK